MSLLLFARDTILESLEEKGSAGLIQHSTVSSLVCFIACTIFFADVVETSVVLPLISSLLKSFH